MENENRRSGKDSFRMCHRSYDFQRRNKMSGETITNAMKPMHDRSNGLGGGFAGYGIYPEYKDLYAFHMFFDSRAARKGCEAF